MSRKNNLEVFQAKKFLTHAMTKLDEEIVFNLVKQGLEQGVDSFEIIEEARAGMEKVGMLYDEGKYFLGDLIVGAEIFLEVLNLVFKSTNLEPVSNVPPIVFGTVGGDIHDIGKNITIAILKSKGYQVCDLGVDVSEGVFIEAIKKTGSQMLCLSGLITPAYDSMKKTVDLLENEGLRSQVSVVIGGLVNDEVKKYTGADYWVTDCTKVSEICNCVFLENGRSGVASL